MTRATTTSAAASPAIAGMGEALPPAPAEARLRHLFRHGLRDGGVNPLFHLLRAHRLRTPS